MAETNSQRFTFKVVQTSLEMFKQDDPFDGRLRPRLLIHPASRLAPLIFLNSQTGLEPIQNGGDQFPRDLIPKDLP